MNKIELEIEVNIGEPAQRIITKIVQLTYSSDQEFDQLIDNLLMDNADIWGYSKLFGLSQRSLK